MLRPAAPADRSDLIALVLAEDAAWSDGPEVSAEEAGEVGQIAVARSERGLGIGRALLVHSLRDLLDEAATSLNLGVEAANEHALGLYRSVGFEVVREWRLYARPGMPS